MKSSTILASAFLATAALAPATAGADHRPGHTGGGGGGGTAGALTLAGEPNPVLAGRTLVLSGKLSGMNSSGQNVALRSDPFPFDMFGNAGSATTDAGGKFSLVQRPTLNTRYQARSGNEESEAVTVLVRPRIGLRLSDSTPRRRQRVRFSGRVCPEHDGSLVAIQRRSASGFRTVGRARLRDVPGSTCSRWARAFRLVRDGRFRVVLRGHADHASGISRSRVANVR